MGTYALPVRQLDKTTCTCICTLNVMLAGGDNRVSHHDCWSAHNIGPSLFLSISNFCPRRRINKFATHTRLCHIVHDRSSSIYTIYLNRWRTITHPAEGPTLTASPSRIGCFLDIVCTYSLCVPCMYWNCGATRIRFMSCSCP